MPRADLLKSFVVLMRAAGVDDLSAEAETDTDAVSCQWPREEEGHKLVSAFVTIDDEVVRYAILNVVLAIAGTPH
jgi:hypothetical protein